MEEYTELFNEQIFAINTVWVALCAALIFFMEAGFALLEAGFVRAKNAMSIIAKVIIDITFGGIAFFVVGFGIAYGASNGWFALDFGIMEKRPWLGPYGFQPTVLVYSIGFCSSCYIDCIWRLGREDEAMGLCRYGRVFLRHHVSLGCQLGVESQRLACP
jgi:hypothetical protein